MKSEEKRPDAVPVVEAALVPEQAEEQRTENVEMPPQEELVEAQETKPEIERPKASIVWRPFPRPLGSKQAEPPVEEDPLVTEDDEIPEL